MAAPSEVTLKDLSGKWILNKQLSDDTDSVLALQGVGYFMRKAIAFATITLEMTQYADDKGVHIDVEQTATGGIKGTAEHRTLDWQYREHSDHVFGDLKGRSRFSDLSAPDITEDFLKEDWLQGEEEKAGPNGEINFYNDVVAQRGWTGSQVWGFAIIDGKRYYTRRIVIKKGNEVKKIRMVYDWLGKN